MERVDPYVLDEVTVLSVVSSGFRLVVPWLKTRTPHLSPIDSVEQGPLVSLQSKGCTAARSDLLNQHLLTNQLADSPFNQHSRPGAEWLGAVTVV